MIDDDEQKEKKGKEIFFIQRDKMRLCLRGFFFFVSPLCLGCLS
jgi:hypothetical protein